MKINYKQYHMTVVCASLVASLSILDLAGQDGGEIPESIKKEMQFLVGDWNFRPPVTGNLLRVIIQLVGLVAAPVYS